MSLNSGIKPAEGLLEAIKNASLVIAEIKDEQIVLSKNAILKNVDYPCFILLKGDYKGFLMITYIPDNATVKEKMLYSATRSILQKEIEIFISFQASNPKELTTNGINEFIASHEVANPLTDREKEKSYNLLQEASFGIGTTTRSSNAAAIGFPLQQGEHVKSELAAEATAVLLKVDVEREVTVVADVFRKTNLESLPSKVSPNQAYFLFYNHQAKIVFVYISPPSCKIKEKMLFAASRQSIIIQVEQLLGTTIEKKFEFDDVKEFSESCLEEEVAVNTTTKLLFAKPKRPGK